ncbi:MAG: helix-turn-helix transcriptional regulator [Woeseia sp.]
METTPEDLAFIREFGERMRAARDATDLTQEQLAEQAGVDPTTVGKIERGVGNPRLLTISKIILALEQDFADVFPCPPER